MAPNHYVHYVHLILLLNVGIFIDSSTPASDVPFDGGPLSSCERPLLRPDSICRDVVNYSVPTSIARLVAVIENFVLHSLEEISMENGQCKESYRRALCFHRFPRCLLSVCGYNDVIINGQTYTEELTQNCGNIAERLGRERSIFPLDEICSPISELIDGFNFRRCSVNNESYVTPWMLEYLKDVDLTISYDAETLFSVPTCGNMYSFFRCNFIGRCSSRGRVEFINSYESCRNVTNW